MSERETAVCSGCRIPSCFCVCEKKRPQFKRRTGEMIREKAVAQAEDAATRRNSLKVYGLDFSDRVLGYPKPTEEQIDSAKNILGEEDFALFDKVRRGTPDERRAAKKVLWEKHLGLALWFATKRYSATNYIDKGGYCSDIDSDDVASVANLAIAHAIEVFDYTMECRFSTYAMYMMRAEVTKYLNEQKSLAKIPNDILVRINAFERKKSEIERSDGYSPTGEEVYRRLGWDDKTIRRVELARYAQRSVSLNGGMRRVLDNDIIEEGLEGVLDASRMNLQGLPDSVLERLMPVDVQAENACRNDRIRSAISPSGRLNTQQREVVAVRFGFEGGAGETLEIAGDMLGLSRQRAHQIEARALRELSVEPALVAFACDDESALAREIDEKMKILALVSETVCRFFGIQKDALFNVKEAADRLPLGLYYYVLTIYAGFSISEIHHIDRRAYHPNSVKSLILSCERDISRGGCLVEKLNEVLATLRSNKIFSEREKIDRENPGL